VREIPLLWGKRIKIQEEKIHKSIFFENLSLRGANSAFWPIGQAGERWDNFQLDNLTQNTENKAALNLPTC